MLDNEFFPTPENVCRKIKSKIAVKLNHHARILDPSAGNGNILDYMFTTQEKRSYNYTTLKPSNFYAIEIEMEFRYILTHKKYNVIGTDFLEFDEPQKFDLILMNPPFSVGVKHLLHAWDFVKPGGQLICLLNSQTTNNAYSKERELLLGLIDQFGEVEELGQCFRDSERTTNVNVSLVSLLKPIESQSNFAGFDDLNLDQDDVTFEEFADNPLAHSNIIKSLVEQYKIAERCIIDRFEINSKLNFYLKGIESAHYDRDLDRHRLSEKLVQEKSLEDQLQELKSRFWSTVFTRSKLGEKATSSFREKFEDFSNNQCKMSFTEANILEVFALFFQSKEQIMQDSIVSVFDVLSAYDEKNKIHIEGWKTNDAWRVNKKVIIPYCIKFDSNWGGKFDFDSWGKRASMFSDLDKVLCYISGLEFDPNNSITTQLSRSMKAINDGEVSSSDPIITRFCKIKIYKKGTAHLEFTDLELLKEFNRRAAIGKKWLADESSATHKPNHKLKKLNQAA